MVEEKICNMKYIRTYETEEKFLTDKDSTSRGFRLKPTLYKYSDVNNGIYLELDDPRKHGDSTYMEITLDSDVEFSFYIGNKSGDTQTTMNCSIDWGDGTVEAKTITVDDKGFKLAHNYTAGSHKIELYSVERDYSIVGHYSDNSRVKRVILGEGNSYGVGCVVSIGLKAFLSCTSLTSIHIPNSVTSIGSNAFNSCSSLTSVLIPESVTYIEAYVFANCSSLTSVYIPEGVTDIGPWAFNRCSSLTSVLIPESVTTIKAGAFNSCSSLTSVLIPEGVTYIEGAAFQRCSISSINIPESVTEIEDSVFNNCSSLTSVNIPESVTSIGQQAFYSCSSLTSVNIPESVTSIGSNAFSYCTSLTSISSLNTTAPTLNDIVFFNLPKNGTLHIKPGATGYDKWLRKLPSGWTIVEDL